MGKVRKFLAPLAFVCDDKVNPIGWLNLKSCALNLSADEKIDHSPKFLSTIQSRVEFRPEAKCPRWLAFLDRFLPEADKQAFLQEYYGFALSGVRGIHLSLVLHGEGANGKNVVCDSLRFIAGEQNCTSLTFADLEPGLGRFRIAELQDKAVMFCHEVDSKDRIPDAIFKKIVGGDPITAERKGQDPFEFIPRCKMVIIANNMPATRDHSHGLHRRLMILKFEVTIPVEEQDPEFAEKLVDYEGPGILNWAIAGYRRLVAQKAFTIPESSREAHTTYKRDSNPRLSFILDHTQKVNDGGMYLTAALAAFREFCSAHGFVPGGSVKLREALEKHHFIKAVRKEHGVYLSGIALCNWPPDS